MTYHHNPRVKPDVTVSIGPKKFADIAIEPEDAPDIHVIRDKSFKTSLVEIEAANVVKGFCKEEEVIEVEEECPDCENEKAQEQCVNPKAEKVSGTDGKELDFTWKNAVEVKCAVLLAICGNKLAKLTGEGALWLEKGKVCARKDIPLKISKLWHKWYLPTPNSSPLMGQPMPFPYLVVSDLVGNGFGIKGLADEDSVTVWDFEEQHFYQKPLTDFPPCVRRKLAYSNRLELMGVEPLGVSDDPSLLRCLKRIDGQGILVLKQEQTAPSEVCECGDCEIDDTGCVVPDVTSVAQFVPNPTGETVSGCPWLLGFNSSGEHQWIDPSSIDCIKGEKGEKGDQGIQGTQGTQGEQGVVGSGCCD